MCRVFTKMSRLALCCGGQADNRTAKVLNLFKHGMDGNVADSDGIASGFSGNASIDVCLALL